MAVAPIKLPRLPANQRLINPDGTPTLTYSRWWQSVVQQVETAVNGILELPGIQEAIDAAQAAADAANAAAATANTAADAAQTSADAVTASSALANSYVSGLTLSATDAGASVTVTISAHTRTYATDPPTSVSVSGGSVTGVPYSVLPDTYTAYIFYDQASRAGGSVTYQYTNDNSAVAQINDRHSVGAVTSPEAAGADVDGRPISPPGGSYERSLL